MEFHFQLKYPKGSEIRQSTYPLKKKKEVPCNLQNIFAKLTDTALEFCHRPYLPHQALPCLGNLLVEKLAISRTELL